MPKLTGKVAKILNERELAITIGAELGVAAGMIFSVRDQPSNIIDPESKRVLGTLSREKVKVKVSEVFPLFSIARTFETYEVTLQRGNIRMPETFRAEQTETRVRTLRKGDDAGPGPLDPDFSYVRIGDPVELIETSAKK